MKKFEYIFTRFDTIHGRDRQTDRQTDGIGRANNAANTNMNYTKELSRKKKVLKSIRLVLRLKVILNHALPHFKQIITSMHQRRWRWTLRNLLSCMFYFCTLYIISARRFVMHTLTLSYRRARRADLRAANQ